MAHETILIVEDDPTLLLALKDNFEFSGYTVATASDGESALDKALALRPDLIVLDIMLPGLNGYEICRAIREQELDMPIIMRSSPRSAIGPEAASAPKVSAASPLATSFSQPGS